MQYPAGALQPARLARPGQGGGEGLEEEEMEMGVSLGPILWRSLSSIVTLPPSIRPILLTHDARCQATGAQQPKRTAASVHCPCLLPSHHGCFTLPCGHALLTRHE